MDESIPQWFSHIERMGNDRIAKRLYMRESLGMLLSSSSMGEVE